MTELINDLLTLSKLEGGVLDVDEGQMLDVAAMLAQALQNMLDGRITQKHKIILDIDQDLGLLGIEGDIISIYSNLIENACKYTPSNTDIQVKWWQDKSGEACLQVTDNGPGFDASAANDITQRFSRLNNQTTSATEGTGLGLAIVKHAVMRHGGNLDIESQPGKGSQFTVCFPASRSHTI
jgi:two-component system phosphate regulon sensor histidine kinase PhoR